MIPGEVPFETKLPGYDALFAPARQNASPLELTHDTINYFQGTRPHAGHLNNKHYVDYLKINKVFVGEAGSNYLAHLGEELEKEQLPEFLDAAGWAFAEAALINQSLAAQDRLKILTKAEEIWQRALEASDSLHKTELGELLRSDSQPFRIALNIAYLPLMKAMVAGNVTDSVRQRVLIDTLAISDLVIVHRHLAWMNGVGDGVAEFSGLLHECNILAALLMLDDPRYLPLPSSSRADNGYFYRNFTHDIIILNQHFGEIKKIIPLEAKMHPSRKDRQRYKALLVSKGDLSLTVHSTLKNTTDAFSRVLQGNGTQKDIATVDGACGNIVRKLADYQRQQIVYERKKMHTRTKFYSEQERSRKIGQLANKPIVLK